MRVPLAEWLPDMPALDNPGATVATNGYPRTAKSYGPINDLDVTTDALTARCQGAFAARDADGNVEHFAGDATKLYKLSAGSWSNVSGSTYATSNDNMWRFAQSGMDGTQRLFATNFIDEIQTWQLGVDSAFSDLSANAPMARHIAEISPGFLMAGNTFDSTDGNVPNRVWWSAINDPTSWPTPGSASAQAVQSDYSDLISGGWVQALVGAVGGASGAVFCETAVYRIDYEGPPTVLRFTAVEKARGTPAPDSVINVGPFAFYLGEDGFYAFDGSQSVSIGHQKVDKYFFANLDSENYHRIVAAQDPINKLIFWAYPSTSSDGTPDRLLIYNWKLGRWAEAQITVDFIYRALSAGYTLEQLDNVAASIEDLPFSLDSRAWTGGRIVLAGFNTAKKQGFFEGDALAATFETAEFGTDNGKRVFIQGVRPLVDGGTITAAIKHRATPQASLTTSTATSAGVDGICPQRVSTRYARAQVNIAAAGSWNHAQGVEPYMREEGMR